MDINVREASAEDYDSLCELFAEIDSLHRDNLPRMFQKPDGAAREKEYYLGLLADEDVALFVSEAEGKLAGFIHAIIRDAPVFPVFVRRRYVIVDGIAVRSGLQNQGLGKMLMGKIQEWAAARGAASIELNVYEFNQAAISFYEKLGYQTLSRKMSKEIKTDGR